jgi:hypothetical protein
MAFSFRRFVAPSQLYNSTREYASIIRKNLTRNLPAAVAGKGTSEEMGIYGNKRDELRENCEK